MDQTDDRETTLVDATGEALYEEVLGKAVFDEQHPKPLIGVREFTINHLFAKIWSRSTETDLTQRLTMRERRLVTIALLAAQGRPDQLRDHVTGARRAGLGEPVLIDLMVHVAHYAGWAAGTSGQTTVQDVFKPAESQR
jgi:4-carboxymuconolactone decarboxylase